MILCAGEALIDMLPRQTEAGEAAFAPYPGGSVFNTAVALARLGIATEFFTGLSSDLFGERLAGVLAANGVGLSLTPRFDRPTTLAFVTLSAGQATYAFYDENTAGRLLTADDLPDLPADLSAAFFGGISLAVEPCALAYAALSRRLPERTVMMLDPNIRPGFITNEKAFRTRMAGMLARADIVKLSDEDLAWLAGDGPRADLVAGLHAQGPGLIVVTEGAAGATAYGPAGEVHVAAEPVDVVDTVGAGDTFNAGLLAGLHEAGLLDRNTITAGLPTDGLRRAVELGVRAAAVTVTRAGAQPPKREDLS